MALYNHSFTESCCIKLRATKDGERPLRKVVLSAKVRSRSKLEGVQTPSFSVTSGKKWPPTSSTDPAFCCPFPSLLRWQLHQHQLKHGCGCQAVACFALRCQSRLGGRPRNQGGICILASVWWPPNPLFQPNVGIILRGGVIKEVADGVMPANTVHWHSGPTAYGHQ